MNIQKTTQFISFKKAFFIALLIFSFSIIFVDSAKAADWKKTPAQCPSVYEGYGQTGGPGEGMCGVLGNTALWFSTSSLVLLVPTSSTSTNNTPGQSLGGYVVDCHAYDASPLPEGPFCDNNTNFWCSPDPSCNSLYVKTTCNASKWAIDSGAFTCVTPGVAPSTTGCISGYANCDAAPNNCEVRIGVTTCTGAGGLQGTFNASCDCIVPASNFRTGIQAEFLTSSPLLWGKQYGDGDLIRFTNNAVATSSFVVFNSGQVAIGHNINVSTTSVAFEVSSTQRGILIPRLGGTNPITNGVDGELYYNTTSKKFMYFNGSAWGDLGGGSSWVTTTLASGLTGLYPEDISSSTLGIGSDGQNIWLQTSSTPRLYVAENGNLGVGTTSPASKLSINSNYGYNSSQPALLINDYYNGDPGGKAIIRLNSSNGSSDVYLDIYSENQEDGSPYAGMLLNGPVSNPGGIFRIGSAMSDVSLYFTTSNTERMIINSNGNIGIGTINPSGILHTVSPGFSTVPIFERSATGNDKYTALKVSARRSASSAGGMGPGIDFISIINSSVDPYGTITNTVASVAGLLVGASSSTGRLAFYTNNEGSLTEKMTIDNNGNVGIGTSTPNAKLHIYDGGIKFNTGGVGSGSGDMVLYSNSGIIDLRHPNDNPSQILRIANAAAYSIVLNSEDDSYFNNGNIGIGTTDPLTKLHLANDGAILATGTIGSGWTGDSLGAGTRLMWIPRKAAFRAGGTNGTQLDSGNIGDYSTSFGYNNKASGVYSFIGGGWFNNALNDSSFVAGGIYNTAGYASGGYSAFVSGNHNTATGTNSFIGGGTYNSVSGLNSVVLGGQYMSVTGDNSFGINLYGDTTSRTITQNNTLAIMGGKVGIGKVDPVGLLTLGGGGVTGSISILPSGGGAWMHIHNNNDGHLIISDGSSVGSNQNFAYHYSGRLGIGTTSPATGLHLVSASGGDGTWNKGLLVENTNSSVIGEAAVSFKNTTTSGYWFTGLNQSGHYDIAYGTSFTNSNTMMRVTNDGKVGIGTTTPTAALHIDGGSGGSAIKGQGDLYLYSSSGYITLSDPLLNTKPTLRIPGNSNYTVVFNPTGDSYVHTGGDFGVGTSTPQTKLHVDGSVRFSNLSSSNLGINLIRSSTGDVYWYFNISDERLKENINLISNKIDVIKAIKEIRGVYFNWNSSSPYYLEDKKTHVGVIAQDVEKYLPEIIEDYSSYDFLFKGIKYENLVPLLVEVAKVQQTEIEALREAVSTTLSVQQSGGQLTYSGGDLDLQNYALLNVKNITGTDNKWAIDENGQFITRIQISGGNTKEMFAMQSPYSEFVFSSSSELINGEAIINFDPDTCELIDENQPLKVNITLTGECGGIFVKEKSATGFVVKELKGGTSTSTFDWMVIAKRKFVVAPPPTPPQEGGEGEVISSPLQGGEEGVVETPTSTEEIIPEPLIEESTTAIEIISETSTEETTPPAEEETPPAEEETPPAEEETP